MTSVFLNINFCAKMSILGKNNWSSVRNVDFLKLLCTTTESEYLIGKHAHFQKILTFCVNECLYTLRNCQNMIKTSIFLRKCLFVHVLIFIRVFLLLENCYFDSKYDFIRWYFGQKCHFSNKIYFSCGINSLEKSRNFFEKRCQFSCQFREKWQLVLEVI